MHDSSSGLRISRWACSFIILWLGAPLSANDRVGLEAVDAVGPRRLPAVELAPHRSATAAIAASYTETPVERVSNSPRTFVGYDDGFVVANHGTGSVSTGDFPFLMRANGWFHLRHTLFDSDGPNLDQNSFSFERLRLAFAGHAFTPDLGYFLQFDGNTDRESNVIFLDYFATYDSGRGVFDWDAGRFGFKFGKWKVPFSRSREETGRHLQFADRASANLFFDLNRSTGGGFFGRLEPLGTAIHYEAAVFNGPRTGVASTRRREEDIDTNIGCSVRSYTDLFSDFGDDGEPDLSWHKCPTLRLGGGMAYTRIDNQGMVEFTRQRGVDSGETLATPATSQCHRL